MTGNERSGRGLDPVRGSEAAATAGPRWSLDLLADLHAGALDPEVEAELRSRVAADPQAREVLAALDATVDELAALPPVPMPAEVAERIDKALAAEAWEREASRRGPAPAPVEQLPSPPPPSSVPVERPAAPVVDIEAARQRRNRRLGWGAGLLATAAAVLGLVFVNLPRDTGGSPQPGAADDGAGSPPLALSEGDVRAGKVPVNDVLGARDYGPLEGPERIRGCLAAAGITDPGEPLGTRTVQLEQRKAVLVLLPTGEFTRYRLVVLGDECGPDKPQVLSDTVIGRR
ncbi:hypothetical protein GCM10012275_41530 [Longimycelium tulufanense]|uniref:Uncharacterized protein n=1 Tax=Longimycelium tulufanense TaxID=907463 RepID=A0A8J3FXX4_9PSEU|nr:hypothetical protein [Longimycelium tulufanense]GGM66737.1 hypothetical protein GCM10012275_41530 [Longimycelium tulufanense]